MSTISKPNHRIILNTSFLYGKMLVSIVISLITIRIVLNSLGSQDFGIFSLVAGVIALLSFLNTAMTISTQRFLSYHQGREDFHMQEIVFGNSLFLHLCIGILVFFIIIGITPLLFNNFLNIPAPRLESAKIVYYYVAVTMLINIVSVPFIAAINANEDIYWIALTSIVEVLLKLGMALIMYYNWIQHDYLEFYGFSTTIVSLVIFTMYTLFSLKKYIVCTISSLRFINKKILKELSSFAGWNLFGALCATGRIQGIAIILNLSLGASINAAYGIANQVSGQMYSFSGMLLRAINPQIMKSEGAGIRERTLKLSMIACKFGFFLLSFFAIPCIFEIKVVLTLWLKEVPAYTSNFCVLTLIAIMINQLTVGLPSALQASGKIKGYQSIVGTVLMLNIPLTYLLLKIGINTGLVLVGMIFIESIACVIRIYLAKRIVTLKIGEYIKNVIKPVILPFSLTTIGCICIVSISNWEYRIFLTILTSSTIYICSIYCLGINGSEKSLIKSVISNLHQRFKKIHD